jgi:hypothetical protein
MTYIIKFVCDDIADITVNDKYKAKSAGPRVKTLVIPEYPHKIVARCVDTGWGCGFKCVVLDDRGNIITRTGDGTWASADGSPIGKGTNQGWGRELDKYRAVAIWTTPVPNPRHRDKRSCVLVWKSHNAMLKYGLMGIGAFILLSAILKKRRKKSK